MWGGTGGGAVQNRHASKAIAKARTAALFASTQDAFTTRTARFIIQDHFPQPVQNTPGGPLYGVEFSSQPFSDALPTFKKDQIAGEGGLPLNISGDPGGIPLYKNGVPVGGVGFRGMGMMWLRGRTCAGCWRLRVWGMWIRIMLRGNFLMGWRRAILMRLWRWRGARGVYGA